MSNDGVQNARRRRDLTTTGAAYEAETIEIQQGPFYLTDDRGFGPVISRKGVLHNIKLNGWCSCLCQN